MMRPIAWVSLSPMNSQVLPPSLLLNIAGARRDRIAGILFAGAEVEGVAVGRRDRHVTHGDDGLVHAEDLVEGGAGVGGLPEPARGRGHVEGARGTGLALDVGDAPAHVGGTDGPPFEGGKEGAESRGGGDLGGER